MTSGADCDSSDALNDTTASETSDSDGEYARLRDVSFPGPTRKTVTQVLDFLDNIWRPPSLSELTPY